MKIPTLFRYAFGVAVSAVLLAGCSNGGSSSGLANGIGPGGITPASVLGHGGLGHATEVERLIANARLHPDITKRHFNPHWKWVKRDLALSPRLLFQGDETDGTVNVFLMGSPNKPKGMSDHVGTVTGFQLPFGECADTMGNVFVVDYLAKNITRISRNGTAFEILKDLDGSPVSCAVDPSGTGNVAVTNLNGADGSTGNVVIYVGGDQPGQEVTNPDMMQMDFAAYDTSGDLWVDGSDAAGNFVLSSCTLSGCTTIPISGGTIGEAGFVQWARGQNMWYVADDACVTPDHFCIYPVAGSGALGSSIHLEDGEGITVCSMFQGVITNSQSKVFVGGANDSVCGGGASVDRWPFPAGGARTNGNDNIVGPTGTAISAKPNP
ncbi:MAG TPA: hypothetical protein VGI19_19610 [Candidatus Cybelea sp.]|jgi:hypothetical protein